MTTLLITGATRGLGLATARAAAARGTHVLCAGRDARAVEAVAQSVGGTPVLLDLADLRAVRDAVARLPTVDLVACNAAVQVVRGARLTDDGFEETFQVNHLAHLALVDALLARPAAPRRVVLVGSGTHDPALPTGLPDPDEGPVAGYARSVDDAGSARTAGLRRYATSKLLAVATAAALAREHPAVHVTCLDPGLMPGTGLAREHAAVLRALWSTVLKGLRVLPFASTPEASGHALAALLCDDPPPAASGAYVDYRLRTVRPSVRAQDPAYQDAVLHDSRQLLAAIGSLP